MKSPLVSRISQQPILFGSNLYDWNLIWVIATFEDLFQQGVYASLAGIFGVPKYEKIVIQVCVYIYITYEYYKYIYIYCESHPGVLGGSLTLSKALLCCFPSPMPSHVTPLPTHLCEAEKGSRSRTVDETKRLNPAATQESLTHVLISKTPSKLNWRYQIKKKLVEPVQGRSCFWKARVPTQ